MNLCAHFFGTLIGSGRGASKKLWPGAPGLISVQLETFPNSPPSQASFCCIPQDRQGARPVVRSVRTGQG